MKNILRGISVFAVALFICILCKDVSIAEESSRSENGIICTLESFDFSDSWNWGSTYWGREPEKKLTPNYLVERFPDMSEVDAVTISETPEQWRKVCLRINMLSTIIDTEYRMAFFSITNNEGALVYIRPKPIYGWNQDIYYHEECTEYEYLLYIEVLVKATDINNIMDILKTSEIKCLLEIYPDNCGSTYISAHIDTTEVIYERLYTQGGLQVIMTDMYPAMYLVECPVYGIRDEIMKEVKASPQDYRIFCIKVKYAKEMKYPICNIIPYVKSPDEGVYCFYSSPAGGEYRFDRMENGLIKSIDEMNVLIYSADKSEEEIQSIISEMVLAVDFSTEFIGFNLWNGENTEGYPGVRFTVYFDNEANDFII